MTLRTIDGMENRRLCLILVTKSRRDRIFLSQKLQRYTAWLSLKSNVFTKDEGETFETVANEIVQWFKEEHSIIAILDDSEVDLQNGQKYEQYFRKNSIDTLFIQYQRDSDTNDEEYGYGENKHICSQKGENCTEEQECELIQLEDDLTYVKLRKNSNDIIINKVQNYLQTRVIFYILNINMEGKSIWLSRHGESMFNIEEKIGGDSSLSPRGKKYAQKLPELIKSELGNSHLVVWTSTLRRTQETAQYLSYEKLAWKALDELDAGVCDGMTYKEIEERYPEDFKARDDDKYQYRYRGGESYADVVNRIEPVIMELERQDHVLIITHQAVLRCIYAYFMNVPQGDSPWMTIPLHTLIKLTPTVNGVKVDRFTTDIPAVSTYKEKGSSDITDTPSSNSSKYANILEQMSNKK